MAEAIDEDRRPWSEDADEGLPAGAPEVEPLGETAVARGLADGRWPEKEKSENWEN